MAYENRIITKIFFFYFFHKFFSIILVVYSQTGNIILHLIFFTHTQTHVLITYEYLDTKFNNFQILLQDLLFQLNPNFETHVLFQ